jgi:hypothetical protein
MTPPTSGSIRCSVEGAERLPEGITDKTICDAVRGSAEPALQQGGFARDSLSVVVTVASATKLVAAAQLAGKPLPEHRVAISDRTLNAQAVAMLANAIAAEIASTRQ